MSNKLYFEHPLNERIRTFLRLEHLCEKIEYFRPQPSHWATRAAIESLLDLVTVTSRSDIKNELIRELDRNLVTLQRVRRQPSIDLTVLDTIVTQLETASKNLSQINGQIATLAREDEFLKAIAQRNSIPGGACSFDLPHYHHLLMKSQVVRMQLLERWSTDLTPVNDAIRLVLSLARTSAMPREEKAIQGFFQETLDPAAPAQLVRIGLDADLPYFPEISGHRNRFSIRFLTAEDAQRPIQTRDDISFTLICCIF
ncbi:cell division protein ZapD [Rhodopseudomonas palustris]|uniref:Cell division protein ZapD n=1 Tax=Thiospirillum jenense TaxID=1653858 RepID=A0A839HC39_9GAMM|nr:cell division protein ZapD [Rhodopseudomonas palustris]MBB1124848.1 cell division protein ZapD [Thiospirillum jenense]